jgi:hypothetical protein
MKSTVEAAKAAVRKRKRVQPQCFPEYMDLIHARANHREATKRLKNARNAWNQLGK